MERYRYGKVMTSQQYRNHAKKNVNYPNKYASLTLENRQQTFVFRRCDMLMPFFIKLFYLKNTYRCLYIGKCLGVFQ